MKSLLLSLMFVFSISVVNADVNKAANSEMFLIANGWADGMDCDAYAAGAYYGYLNGNPGDLAGATSTSNGAFWDCMGGGGFSRAQVIISL